MSAKAGTQKWMECTLAFNTPISYSQSRPICDTKAHVLSFITACDSTYNCITFVRFVRCLFFTARFPDSILLRFVDDIFSSSTQSTIGNGMDVGTHGCNHSMNIGTHGCNHSMDVSTHALPMHAGVDYRSRRMSRNG